MHKNIGETMDLVRAARQYIEKVAEEAASVDETVRLIRAAVSAELLDIDGQLLLRLEAGAVGVAAALCGAEESLADADKQLGKAAKHDAETQVATMLQEHDELEAARDDVENCLGQARSRIEEVRKFGKLCTTRIEGLDLPKLKIA